MTTEPLEKGLSDRIQQDLLFKPENRSLLADLLMKDYNWDELTANSVWAPNFTVPLNTLSLFTVNLRERFSAESASRVVDALIQYHKAFSLYQWSIAGF